MDLVTPHVGVWIETRWHKLRPNFNKVTPHVGVWIETGLSAIRDVLGMSLPMWECGLKHFFFFFAKVHIVTPHVGVWIETRLPGSFRR